MDNRLFKYILTASILIHIGCAKRGNITGGAKDTIPPVLKTCFPKNFSTEFKGNLFKLTFDEYIKLKNIRKQLIISPPMKNEPLILPATASKTITIKIIDTLQTNTTYSFNFGQSLADNNEGNSFNQFKYVFSTGKNIDSLTISGKVRDAYTKDVAPFVSVMLYEVNHHFKDSIVYKQLPRYMTSTLDSLNTFKLENLRKGKYLLVAMKDSNNDNKYDPKKETIGFYKNFISIPSDTVYELCLFKETLPFKVVKPSQISGNRLLLGYEGTIEQKADRPQIILKNNNQIIASIVTKMPKKDSLQIWYKPIKADSLVLEVIQNKYQKKYPVRIKEQKKDTLTIKAIQQNHLDLSDRFTLQSATPLVHFDKSKMSLTNKAKATISFATEYDEFHQLLYFDFKKEPEEEYTFNFMKGALTDLYEKSNDSLTIKLKTKPLSEYGNLTVNLEKVKKFPVIVELTDEKGNSIVSEYTEKNTRIHFNLVKPAPYTLRAIYDDNKNRSYDPGNYLEKKYAEEVIYLSNKIDVRANWDVIQAFDLSIPYTPTPKKKRKGKEEKKK